MAKRQKSYEEKPLKPSLVPPWLAALFSAAIPGLGQALARKVQRGIILFFSSATIAGLMVWRFKLAAPRDHGFLPIVTKAFYLQPILILISILIGLFYIWIIIDAFQLAKNATNREAKKSPMVSCLWSSSLSVGKLAKLISGNSLPVSMRPCRPFPRSFGPGNGPSLFQKKNGRELLSWKRLAMIPRRKPCH